MLLRSILDMQSRMAAPQLLPPSPLLPAPEVVMPPAPMPRQKRGNGPLGNGLSLGGGQSAPQGGQAAPQGGPLGSISNFGNIDPGMVAKIFSMFGGV